MSARIVIHTKDKIGMLANLSTMLSAGIPILDAVETLRQESKAGSRRFLDIVAKTISDGHPLSEAFAQAPDSFDPVTINLIKAGEEAGTLEESLKQLTKTIRKDAAFRERLRASLIYPAFIIVTFFSVLVLILTFVIPRISKVFSSMRVPLPAPTKVTIAASDFLLKYYPFIIVGIILTVIVVTVLYKTHRRAVIATLLSLPGLRKLGLQIDLTRFTHSMGTLLHAGIPIVEALRLSRDVTTKKQVRLMIDDCEEHVSAGKPLSEGMRKHKGVVPIMIIQIIEAAESSGTLDVTMLDIGQQFEHQVSSTLKTFTALLEPISLVVIGGMVGGMMLSVIAPIYGMISKLKAV